MDEGKVGFMDLTALLHFSEKGGVLFAPAHKKKAAGFAVEPTDKGKEFLGIVVTEPVDQSEGAIGSGGVDQPSCGFIHDQEGGVIEEDGRFHGVNFEGMCDTSKGGKIRIRIKMRMNFGETAVPVL